MLVLAIESSTDITSAALGNVAAGQTPAKLKIISSEKLKSDRYSETTLALIDGLFKGQKKTIKDIDEFVVGTGPGSFTGVRASIAIVKSLAQALRKPATGMPSTYSVAHSIYDASIDKNVRKIVVSMDARRDEVLYEEFEIIDNSVNLKSSNLIGINNFIELLNADKGKDFIIGGTALNLIDDYTFQNLKSNISNQDTWIPDATSLLIAAKDSIGKTNWKSLFDVKPLYWRRPDALTVKERKYKP